MSETRSMDEVRQIMSTSLPGGPERVGYKRSMADEMRDEDNKHIAELHPSKDVVDKVTNRLLPDIDFGDDVLKDEFEP